MTREELFKANRGEREYYLRTVRNIWGYRRQIPLPLTYDGFQALAEIVCAKANVPMDDAVASVLCGYIHHIAGDVSTTRIKTLVSLVQKSFSNNMTWNVDQEIKAARAAAAEAAKTVPAPQAPASDGPSGLGVPKIGLVPPPPPEQGSVPAAPATSPVG